MSTAEIYPTWITLLGTSTHLHKVTSLAMPTLATVVPATWVLWPIISSKAVQFSHTSKPWIVRCGLLGS